MLIIHEIRGERYNKSLFFCGASYQNNDIIKFISNGVPSAVIKDGYTIKNDTTTRILSIIISNNATLPCIYCINAKELKSSYMK